MDGWKGKEGWLMRGEGGEGEEGSRNEREQQRSDERNGGNKRVESSREE